MLDRAQVRQEQLETNQESADSITAAEDNADYLEWWMCLGRNVSNPLVQTQLNFTTQSKKQPTCWERAKMTLIERKSNGFICTSVRLEWSYNPELCYFGYLELLLYRHYERRKILL